jgi:hypothetical protein
LWKTVGLLPLIVLLREPEYQKYVNEHLHHPKWIQLNLWSPVAVCRLEATQLGLLPLVATAEYGLRSFVLATQAKLQKQKLGHIDTEFPPINKHLIRYFSKVTISSQVNHYQAISTSYDIKGLK